MCINAGLIHLCKRFQGGGGGGLVNEGAYKIENSMCAAAMLEE